MDLAYFSTSDVKALKDKNAAKNRLKFYKTQFDNIYVFCLGNRNEKISKDGIKYISVSKIFIPFALFLWLYHFFPIRKNVSHVKILDGFLGGLTGYLAARISKAKLVIRYGGQMRKATIHGLKERKNSLGFRLMKICMYVHLIIFEDFIFKRCDVFVSNSRAIVPEIVKDKAVVIYNGVDTRRFQPGTDNGAVIGYVGAITEMKGMHYLVPALKRLPNKKIFIGDGDMLDYCKRELPNSSFRGFVSTGLEREYDKFDILIFSTVKKGNDSFPNSVLEAMSSGKRVVASRMGGIPEMIKHMKDGIIIEPNSSEAIYEGIKKLEDKVLYKKLGINARKRVEKDFEWETQMKKLCEVLFE